MSHRVRVLKRFDQWHWWCPDCMGGDWGPTWTDAIHQADRHARDYASAADQVRRGIEYIRARYGKPKANA